MNPQEASVRPLFYNDIERIKKQAEAKRADAFGEMDPYHYENAVADMVKLYGGVISPQEIGDTLYNIYKDTLGTPNARYYGVDPSVGGGTGGTPQVTADLSGKIKALNDMYGVIYNDLANLTKEKRASLESSYGDQTKNLQDTYQDVSAQLPMQYGAQGIGQSSYYAKAAGRAEDAYNQNTKALQDAQTQSLADLGRFYQTNLGNFQGQQAALASTPASYTGSQADVQNVQSGLDTQLNQLGQARTGLQTQGQNIAGLSAIAPSQNTGAAQLRKMLGELSGSSIPDFAKQTIAQNEIKKSGQDQTYYTDYFDRLRQQTPGA